MRDMANDEDTAAENPNVLQHMSEAHIWHPMARENKERRFVGVSVPRTCGKADLEEEVELDWSYPQEANIQHHTTSPELEPSR